MKRAWFTILALGMMLAPALYGELPELNGLGANKLLHMYQFYYLPFSVEFQQGRTLNEILPYWVDAAGTTDRLLSADELRKLDKEWNELKTPWVKRSLLLGTPVNVGQSIRISAHLVSHKIGLTRSAFDTIPLAQRAELLDTLKSKPADVQAEYRQERFLRSFLNNQDEEKFNFVMVSASWCDSCKEYRTLIEAYAKLFPDSSLTIHSVVIDDPKEEIFESNLLKELFPNPKKYTHESIPRFLAIQTAGGKTTVWEEGDALKELYERYFKNRRGFFDRKVTVGPQKQVVTAGQPLSVDPKAASITR
jgi:thiol-disulfide isomerase/thioredoxin